MDTFLYLIRHGETDWNKERRIQGHSDIHLNDLGKKQVQQLARYMSAHSFSHVYTSDLRRAYDTGKPLADAKGIDIRTLSTLRERCYGEFEGSVYEDIREKFSGIQPHESLHGIESFVELQGRAQQQLTSLACAHPNERIVVVSHGGFINSFLHYISGGRQGTGITKIDNTGICLLRYDANGWNVEEINRVDHLQSTI